MKEKLKTAFKSVPLILDFMLKTKEEKDDLYSPWMDFGFNSTEFFLALGKDENVCKAFNCLSLEQAKSLYSCLGRWISLMEEAKAA